MQQVTLYHYDSPIHFTIFGSGNRPLFCFHGYGLQGTDFCFLEAQLGLSYRIYAIDFPHHGQSVGVFNHPFTPEVLWLLMEQVNETPELPVSILAYSMGGRIALRLYQAFPQHFFALVLIAPDGLHKNIWQYISTQTAWGNLLFKKCMENPQLILSIIHFAAYAKLVNKSIVRFVLSYLDKAPERQKLYLRWTYLKHFTPKLTEIKQLINQYHTPITLVFGKYDRIILTKTGRKFLQNNHHCVKLIEIEAGHQLLKPKYTSTIAAFFTH